MTKLTKERINFIERLHEIFYMKKGYGAFAFISISEAMSLFDKYLDTNESADLFINQFLRSQ
jgi:hypothetical protein